MQNSIRRVAVIFPIIILLYMSLCEINVKAEEKVYKQDGIVTTDNKSSEDNKLSNSAVNNVTTGDDKININQNKEAEKASSSGLANASGTNTSDINVKQDQKTTEILPGWRNIDGKLHYVTKEGILKQTGWFKEKDKNPDASNNYEYYLDENYAATIGWKQINGLWYYFNEAGIKQVGWQFINYNWYYLDEKGRMETGWITYDRRKYYLSEDGIMTMGKKNIDNKWYFFGANGMLQDGIYTYNGKKYYSNEDGVMGENEWIKVNKDKYYVKADSGIATGIAIINNEVEKFDSNGKYVGPGKTKESLFVKQLRVGNADCAFIKLPDGESVLIDTGDANTSEKVINFLKKQNLNQEDGKGVIDSIVITHAHSDHIGGLASILNNFKVKKVYIPDVAVMKDWYSNAKITSENPDSIEMLKTDYKIYKNAVQAMKDNNIQFTNTKKGEFIDKNNILQFVQSDKNFGPIGSEKITGEYWGINENSAIVYLNYGDLQELFTADMEWNSEKDFWTNDLLNGRNVDVLKVPHHGNDTSSTSDFINYLKPDIGIISRGSENVKRNEAYKNLISNGVSLYETSSKDGVSIYATPENWTVQN